jgi:hypothetical protein
MVVERTMRIDLELASGGSSGFQRWWPKSPANCPLISMALWLR